MILDSDYTIKLSNHFILYIPLKDKIIFESELYNTGVKFYLVQDHFRYHFLVEDSDKVDEIIINNDIIAGNDSISTGDYREDKKAMKMYLIAFVAIAVLILIIVIFENYYL